MEKINLKDIVVSFETVTTIYDSIDDFSRKWALVPAYKELKEAVSFYEEQREKLLIENSDEAGKVNNPIGLHNGMKKLQEAERELSHPLRFTKLEVEKSKIQGSKLSDIMIFIK